MLTTFEVARHCGVHHTTAIAWVRKGKLKAYRTPGGHRRIAARDLVEFMGRFGMPVPAELSERPRRIPAARDGKPPAERLLRRAHALLEKPLARAVLREAVAKLLQLDEGAGRHSN